MLPLAIDQHTFFSTLHNVFPSAAIFTVIPGFPQATLPSREDESNLLLLLSSLYDCKYAECNPDELSQIVWHKLTDICFTTKEAAFLENSTRAQSCSSLWYDHRQGRITASMFGRVFSVLKRSTPHP